MTLRRQLPVYSPLRFGVVAAAARAALIDTGAAGRELEDLLRQHFGAVAVLLTDSGTSGLSLAIRAAAAASPTLRPIALPAYGCYDLATGADGAGVEVLLYDVDPQTLGPDLGSLETALRGGAGTVVVASLYGMPIDLDAVNTLAAPHGAVIVEDAAQGVGMTWRSRLAGGTGSFGVLSFGRGKGVTGGGGGALLLNNAKAISALDSLAFEHRRFPRGLKAVLALFAQWALARPEVYALPASLPLGLGETRYSPPARIGGISVATCAAVLRTLPLGLAEVAVRQRHALRLLKAAEEGSRFTGVAAMAEASPSYLRLPLVASGGSSPFADLGAGKLGVMPGYPLALCDLPGFAHRVRNSDAGFPGSRTLAEKLGTLPTHSRLTEGDLVRLESWLRRAP